MEPVYHRQQQNLRKSTAALQEASHELWRNLPKSSFTTADWAKTLTLASVFTILGAFAIDLIQPRSHTPLALVVVGPVIAIQAMIFLFLSHDSLRSLVNEWWPKFWGFLVPTNKKPNKKRSKHQKISYVKIAGIKKIRQKGVGPRHNFRQNSKGLTLWDQANQRLNINVFESNIPTFVLSANQNFIDWNIAFNFVFADELRLVRGDNLSKWFQALDNFRRIPKRTERLYGEAILPITDRERVVYLSPVFGRMVFTKIMTPIVDLKNGGIVGWTVVLNINSVNKRVEFFEALFSAIGHESRRIRYRAAYNEVFGHYDGRFKLINAHLKPIKQPDARILVYGPIATPLIRHLLKSECRVTALSEDVHLLRKVRGEFGGLVRQGGQPVRLIRFDPIAKSTIPKAYFDFAACMLESGSEDDHESLLKLVYESVRSGGFVTLSAVTGDNGLQRIHDANLASLNRTTNIEQIKHQFDHVRDFEIEGAKDHRQLDRITLRTLVLGAGFVIREEQEYHQDHTTTLLILQK